MHVDPDFELPVIIVIGSLNVDLTTYTSRIPAGGETLFANSFRTGSGGKGGNQAAACAKLSRNRQDLNNASAIIQMVGAVGDDLYGQMIIGDLRASGVDTSKSFLRKDVETGTAIILVEETSGENRILLNAGANHSLTPSQFSGFTQPLPSLVILQLEIPIPTILHILKVAKQTGVQVLLNPAPAVELPDEAYHELEHLILNETEAAILSHGSESQMEDEKHLPIVTQMFHTRGVKNVVITLGSRGVFYSTGSDNFGLIKAKKVDVVDTTAAGDTFVGAYSLEVVKSEFDIKAAVIKANDAAAMTIGRRGAQASIPWADELV